ncbi:hypothetical protein [Brevifollis gellanilyticus]|uniref:Uncharacterized protein n=1 Tax=Brevifollis gellanilyticus TaxID=748831 RepID=A0A512M8N8_9BACT|nr:hypothetical protein [Brevifollis gellanilyticus]GEP43099.1 hypothetical protein BGE01nite_23900 [Brevifollis gellanilyticus]
MKKAVVILYIIVASQAVCTVIGFAVSYKVLQLSLFEAGKSMGEAMIKICDQRYVQK